MGASASISNNPDDFIDINCAVIDESNQMRSNVPVILPPPAGEDDSKSVPMPKHGVKLRHYDEFIQLCGGRHRLKGLTTADVCDQYIKPMTAQIQGSYCDLLTQQNHPAVGTARVFISHAWKYKFLDVMDALLYHFRHDTNIVIWFDLFSNNQHHTVDLDFYWWSNTFKSAIAEFGHTVMVFAPWNDPIPLTRAWCLFELLCTIQNSCKFDIAMSKDQTKQFFNDMALHGREKVNTMFASIKTEHSECYKREDQEKILQVVRETVGFEKVNQMIFDRFRAWVIKTTMGEIRHALDDIGALRERKLRVIRLKHTIADLYAGQGKLLEAEPMYEECLSLSMRYFGDCHQETLSQMYQLIHFYVNNLNYVKAFPIVMEFILKGEGVLGGEHEMIYEAYKLKAFLCSLIEDVVKAEATYHEVIAHMRKHFGDIHKHTFEAINELGKFCIDKIFPDLLSKTPTIAVSTGLSIGVIARRPSIDLAQSPSSLTGPFFAVYDHLGLDPRFPEIERLLMSNFQQSRQTLGPDDTLILSTIHILTRLYIQQGKYLQAEKLYLDQCKWYDQQFDHKHHYPTSVSTTTHSTTPSHNHHHHHQHHHHHHHKTHTSVLECLHKLLHIYASTKQHITYELYVLFIHIREGYTYGVQHPQTEKTKHLLDQLHQQPRIVFTSSDLLSIEYIESYKPSLLDDTHAALSVSSTSLFSSPPPPAPLPSLSTSPNSVTCRFLCDDNFNLASPGRSGKGNTVNDVMQGQIAMLTEIFEKRKKLFGKSDVDTLLVMQQLAYAYSVQLQHTPALPISTSTGSTLAAQKLAHTVKTTETLWKDCYEKKKANLSSIYADSNAVIDAYEALHDLAVFYHAQRRLLQAEKHYLECVPHFMTSYGKVHVHTCVLYQNMGKLYEELQQYEKAIEYYQECLQSRKELHPDPKHPRIIALYFALILAHIAAHQYDIAEQRILEALMLFHNDHLHSPILSASLRRPTSSSSSSLTASSTTVTSSPGSSRSARKHFPPISTNPVPSAVNALSGEEESERLNLFPKARLLMYLGNLYVYRGKYRPAEKMLKESIPYVEKYLGYSHQDVMESRENIRLIRRLKHDPGYAS